MADMFKITNVEFLHWEKIEKAYPVHLVSEQHGETDNHISHHIMAKPIYKDGKLIQASVVLSTNTIKADGKTTIEGIVLDTFTQETVQALATFFTDLLQEST